MTLVRADVVDGIGRIHLDDPARRNAISHDTAREIVSSVDAAMAAGARAIVLTAEPPVFCSGGVLEDLIEPKAPLSDIYRAFTTLADAPVPTICVVAAPAIGAGVNLPLVCDVVVAGRSAKFDPRFLDVGIHPGGGHLWRLLHRVGYQGAAALSLCGDALTGEEAVVAGLAWRCVDDDDALPLAMRFATRVASRDVELVARAKRTLVEATRLTDPHEAVAHEGEAQQWSMNRPGFADAVRRVQQQLAARKP